MSLLSLPSVLTQLSLENVTFTSHPIALTLKAVLGIRGGYFGIKVTLAVDMRRKSNEEDSKSSPAIVAV